MNNRFVINYTPGPTFLHQLSGFTKVFLFIVMTVAIIATYDVRILWPLCIISVIEMVSMKPNWKPIIFMFLCLQLLLWDHHGHYSKKREDNRP